MVLTILGREDHPMRRHRRGSFSAGTVEGFEAQSRLWSLRLLAYGMRRPRSVPPVVDQNLLCPLLGLAGETLEDLSAAQLRQSVRERLREMPSGALPRSGPLMRNVRRLAKLLELTAAETEVLLFTVVLHSDELLRESSERAGHLNSGDLVRLLTAVLELERADIERALQRDGTLRAAGLVEVDHRGAYALPGKLELLKGAAGALLTEQRDLHALFTAQFRPSRQAEVRLEQYPHLKESVEFLLCYVGRVLETRARGVNILLHGRPGTGKTQLVRALSEALGATLYQVASGDEDGDAIEGTERFRAYRLSQRMLSRRPRHLILFDEVEDVFPRTSPFWFGRESSGVRTKGWVNQLLEENPVPTFWLSNHVNQIDPAYLRRFDQVLELPVPPRAVRREMLQSALGDLPLTEQTLDHLAGNERLTPADIERARKVVSQLGAETPREVEAALEHTLRGHFEVRGIPFSLKPRGFPTLPYDLDYCHASIDLRALAEGLRRRRQGRICLYGPPGTGKTAFGHHLAERLDCRLIERRASDLFDMYLGQTEKNIAAMFRQATAEGAILLLDEADSFLRCRRGAVRSWEVTQVNELLKQLEEFEGIFVCATNLIEQLDEAVLRRFDFKVEYRYLAREQAERLFIATLPQCGGGRGRPGEPILSRLGRLDNLTPGDFATVVRRVHLSGEDLIAQRLLEGLEAESRLKGAHTSRAIGFTASV
jgi:transitional endoplasmic reticulum ATPase